MQPCPRQMDATTLAQVNRKSFWREDGTCSYCGSLNPDQLFRAVAEGCELKPTDKDYKVYVDRPNPHVGKPRIAGSANYAVNGWTYLTQENFDQVTAGFEEVDKNYARNWYLNHWVKVGTHSSRTHDKFYFYHFSLEERRRFIALSNEKKLRFGYPGHFYKLPFFMSRIKSSVG